MSEDKAYPDKLENIFEEVEGVLKFLSFRLDKQKQEFIEWIDYILNSFEGDIPRIELEAKKKILKEKRK